MNPKPKLVSRAVLVPFILVTSLFFAWGFANDITNPMVAAFSYTLRNIRSLPSGSSAAESQYLKLLPPMNSRSIEVGGISADDIFRKLSRNFSSLLASPYSGTVFGTLYSNGSA